MTKEQLKETYPKFTHTSSLFDQAGFYVLLYNSGYNKPPHEEHVYCAKPDAKSKYRQSFWVTFENTIYPDIGHDLGICEWVGGYDDIYRVLAWRLQTPAEEQETRNNLYRFSRKRKEHKWVTEVKC